MDQIETPEFSNPNRALVMKELNKLYNEWLAWDEEVSQIVDQPYDKNTQSEAFADGEEMMQKHEILQAKTFTFLNNNIKGHGFIQGFDGKGCDRTDLRLKHRVKHRLQNLRVLIASLDGVISSVITRIERNPEILPAGESVRGERPRVVQPEPDLPQKVTLSWLVRHVPVSFWITAAGLLVAVFVTGIQASRISVVKEVFRLETHQQPAQLLPPKKPDRTPAPAARFPFDLQIDRAKQRIKYLAYEYLHGNVMSLVEVAGAYGNNVLDSPNLYDWPKVLEELENQGYIKVLKPTRENIEFRVTRSLENWDEP